MKKILVLLLLCSCKKDVPLERPFVIIDMATYQYGTGKCDTIYTFQDKNGIQTPFKRSNKHFEVGDTIK